MKWGQSTCKQLSALEALLAKQTCLRTPILKRWTKFNKNLFRGRVYNQEIAFYSSSVWFPQTFVSWSEISQSLAASSLLAALPHSQVSLRSFFIIRNHLKMTCNARQTWVIPDDTHASFMQNMFHTWHAEKSLKRTCSLNSIGLTGSQCSPWTKTSGKKMGCTIIYKYVMWDSLKITKYLNCAEDCGLSAALDGF